jgi:hypothetical protein
MMIFNNSAWVLELFTKTVLWKYKINFREMKTNDLLENQVDEAFRSTNKRCSSYQNRGGYLWRFLIILLGFWSYLWKRLYKNIR